MTLNDVFVKGGKIAPNGSMLHDMYLVEVKKPEEATEEWDLLKVVSKIPADQAYISMEDTTCKLVNN